MSRLLNALSRIFYRPPYISETTQFIGELKKSSPSLEAQQRAGRALLWEKNIDLAQQADVQSGRVEQQAYVYQTAPKA